jgi:hypothetical protein
VRVGVAAAGGLMLAGLLLTRTQAGAPPAVRPVPMPAPDPASISLTVLPDGKDRALVVRTCAVCHPIELVVATKRSEEDWERQTARMVGFGAVMNDAEQDRILDYLERYFGNGS